MTVLTTDLTHSHPESITQASRRTGALSITCEHLADRTIVRLAGEVTLFETASAATIIRALAMEGVGPIILDISGVSFLAIVSLSMLLRLGRQLRERGRTLALAEPSHKVQQLLNLAQVHLAMPVGSSVEQAYELAMDVPIATDDLPRPFRRD